MSDHYSVVQIKPSPSQTKLLPAQKKFNTLIKNINKQRKLLLEWQEAMTQCQQQAVEKLEPLRKELGEYQAQLVLLLDQQFDSHKFTKNQQEKMCDLILELADVLIVEHQRVDLKPLFDKYSTESFDQLDQASDGLALDMLKELLEQQFGMTIDEADLDVHDIQATLDRLNQQFEQQVEQQEAQRATQRPKSRKSAKQVAKAAEETAEVENVSKSIQAVFRQLSSALHPDRELDPVERVRKTELMQQVTVAYSKKDLLKLLELQLVVEQIDQIQLDAIADTRLKHYNQVLESQLNELKAELAQQEMLGRDMISAPPFMPIVPKHLMTTLKYDIQGLRETILNVQRDLREFQDVKQLKAWLKDYQID
ncbi:hypothetical protein [Thiothrix eikelboomii]|uniref:Molecular chaperone DnaJ n=1 Tax=Thiothrix eikelboomii TaxID=92487 RepID=A0A1T4WCX7_9GAMM|nr:hypothetical protein [Thiothrix eikelboomii]SKA74878.1 hypothetical protein SAMN02745130_01434 [Thiothrix eikelboomii]